MDRNKISLLLRPLKKNVALRKESVDRNIIDYVNDAINGVALRKESVDRNSDNRRSRLALDRSLSARRAWIEIFGRSVEFHLFTVALRKESVDRNLI